jgi:hypothetical protein
MTGYLPPNLPLPARASAKDICQFFPNHIDDHVILTLMRDGLGAKAIDALIPPPKGMAKAAQSHSKIQLRVSAIKENFPSEPFPGTKQKSPDTGTRPDNGKDVHPGDLIERAAPRPSTSQAATGYYPAIGPNSSINDQVNAEHEKHLKLVFEVYYSGECLTGMEMDDAVQAHCSADYDSMSRELQDMAGSRFEKKQTLDGEQEDSVIYLRRSLVRALERVPVFRLRLAPDTFESLSGERLEAAISSILLDQLRLLTGSLEEKVESERQRRAHQKAHSAAGEYSPWESPSPDKDD